MRRPLDAFQSGVPTDSSHFHSYTFSILIWQFSYGAAQILPPEALAALTSPPPIHNLVLEYRHNDGLLCLQPPLCDWNHRANPAGWQIETGPLLWPFDRLSFAAAPSSAGLTSAWLHANQAGRVTISGDGLNFHELEARISLLALA